jgi:F-type H+-transporting ATPase subunit b
VLIDWFTVGAQALNFLILVWLMKHFLYQPILHAIDTREKKIAAELADAAAKQAEAQNDRVEFQHKNEEFDQQRAALLAKATAEAKAERQRLLDEARQAAEALSVKRQETLASDAKHLNQAIARRTEEEVFAIARRALADLASTSLEERIGAVFTRRLREMDGKARETLGAALKTTPAPAVVRSAFELPAEERAKIQNAINETFSADIHLRFETAPDRISGIELTASGQKVAWSIGDYITSLEKGVGELLKQQDKPEPKPEARPESVVQAKSKPGVKAEPALKPKAEINLQPEAVPTGGSRPELKAESKPAARADPPTGAKAVPKSAAAAPKPDTEANPKPDPVAVAKPEPAPESAPETDGNSLAEPKPAEHQAAPVAS